VPATHSGRPGLAADALTRSGLRRYDGIAV